MAGSMSHAIVIYVGQMDVAHDARHSSSVAGQVRGMGAVSRLVGDDEISPARSKRGAQRRNGGPLVSRATQIVAWQCARRMLSGPGMSLAVRIAVCLSPERLRDTSFAGQ